MKSFKNNKFKSILLSSILSISLLVSACSNKKQNTNIDTPAPTKNELCTKEIPKGSVKATVQRVVDGDTMKLKINDTNEVITLRLLLVDTPESVKKGVKPQPYSIEASNFSKQTLKAGDTVYIEYDKGNKTDKYNRHLGYLWFYCKEDSNWEIFNEKLINKGYARVGYIHNQKKYLDKFYKAQDNAKSNKLNIWSVPGYVTDRGYDVDIYNKNTSSNTKNNFSNKSSQFVYANGGNSNKYHSSPSAHNMKGAIKMTLSEAKSSGYTPCGLCY